MHRISLMMAVMFAALTTSAARAQEALPLDDVIDATIDQGTDQLDFVFEATAPGILTVAVRLPGSEGANDAYLYVMDEATAELAPTTEDMYALLDDMLAMQRGGLDWSDQDRLGVPTSEQLAATLPEAGTYIVRLVAEEAATFRLAASFLPFPEVAAEATINPDPIALEPGVPRMADVGPRAPLLYELTAPADGLLVALTRGSGDLMLSAAVATSEDGPMRPAGRSDADQGGHLASESVVLEVQRGQKVQLRVESYEPGRCLLIAQVQPLDAEWRALARKASEGPPHPLVGRPLPALDVRTLDGETMNLADLDARVVVLDVWATWCGPCVAALPEVQKVHEWAEASGAPVAVRALNTGETPFQVRAFLREHDLTLPVLLDPSGAAGEALQARAIPMTVIAVDGVIDHVFTGYVPNHAEHLKALIETRLER